MSLEQLEKEFPNFYYIMVQNSDKICQSCLVKEESPKDMLKHIIFMDLNNTGFCSCCNKKLKC